VSRRASDSGFGGARHLGSARARGLSAGGRGRSVMPTVNMFKGAAARAIDEWYATGDIAANLREAQSFLASGAPFADVVLELGRRGRSKPEFQYPYHDVRGPQFEAVARQAYLQGIALAQRHPSPVPISTFWVAGAANYEAHAVDGLQAVTVTLVVPVPPPPD